MSAATPPSPLLRARHPSQPIHSLSYNSIENMLGQGRYSSNETDLWEYFLTKPADRQPPTADALEQFRQDCIETPRRRKAEAGTAGRGADDRVFVICRAGPVRGPNEWQNAVESWCGKNGIVAINW